MGSWQGDQLACLNFSLIFALPVGLVRTVRSGGNRPMVYKTATGAIEELYVTRGQPWRAANLTQIARGPRATGSFIDAYAWENGGSKQVVYPTSDGHIHELFVTTNSAWEHADLTQISRAPRMR